ncbi:MAG: hypothetical protein LBI70_03820 [Rickettsiales bacterium]|jgi:hypothetical protein|nr:hypothetical protein [Rickettsiales bacterium]
MKAIKNLEKNNYLLRRGGIMPGGEKTLIKWFAPLQKISDRNLQLIRNELVDVLELIGSKDVEDTAREHIAIDTAIFTDRNLNYEDLGVLLCAINTKNFALTDFLRSKGKKRGIGVERLRSVFQNLVKFGYAKMERHPVGGRGNGFKVTWEFSTERKFLIEKK